LLERLQEARLLHRTREGGYAFDHSLIQEAAYASLLRRERKRIHLAVGEALEEDQAGSLEEAAPILAYHFQEAGDDERSLRYRTMAGEAALRVFALPEAIEHFTRAIEISGRRTGEANIAELLHLYSRRGHALELASRHGEALANYEAMEGESVRTGDARLGLEGRMGRAGIYAGSSDRHDAVLAERLGTEALELARALGDSAAEAKTLWSLGILYGFSGRPEEAVSFGERALALARLHGLREQEAFALTDIYRAYGSLGRYPEAWASLDRAQGLWRELGNPPMLADTLSGSVLNDFLRGAYDRAIASAREARRISEEISNLWGQTYSRMFVGSVHLERGEVGAAAEIWEQAIRLCGRSGFAGPLVINRTDQALLDADLLRTSEGIALAEEALLGAERLFPVLRPIPSLALAKLRSLSGDRLGAESKLKEVTDAMAAHDPSQGLLVVRLPVIAGELALAWGDFPRALRWADEAERLGALGIRAPLPYLLLIRGRALLQRGDLGGARRALEEARIEGEALGSRWSLWRVLFTSWKAAERDGDLVAATQLRSEARGVAQYIADHAGDDGLREAFHSLAEVRELYGEP
jgi:tetratricopeptide (TPR) repeat protein